MAERTTAAAAGARAAATTCCFRVPLIVCHRATAFLELNHATAAAAASGRVAYNHNAFSCSSPARVSAQPSSACHAIHCDLLVDTATQLAKPGSTAATTATTAAAARVTSAVPSPITTTRHNIPEQIFCLSDSACQASLVPRHTGKPAATCCTGDERNQ